MTLTSPGPETTAALRVLVVDDHPALRAGLRGLLAGEPGLECVGTLPGSDGLGEALHATRADVVVLDYALGRDDGLATCFRIKQHVDPPAVVLYSAYVDPVFSVPAAIAQADATVAKSAPVEELLAAIRAAAAGIAMRPEVGREMMEAASARLAVDDLPVAGMLLAGTPVVEIAETLDMTVADIRRRALRIIGRLQAGNRIAS